MTKKQEREIALARIREEAIDKGVAMIHDNFSFDQAVRTAVNEAVTRTIAVYKPKPKKA